jgi:hypothetical protein
MRRVFKWAGTMACVFAAVALVISTQTAAVVTPGGRLGFGLIRDELLLVYSEVPMAAYRPQANMITFETKRGNLSIESFILVPRWPSYSTDADESFAIVGVPLSSLLIALGLGSTCLWLVDRRRPAPGACRCGYDLTGNTSGRCPECGQAVAQ